MINTNHDWEKIRNAKCTYKRHEYEVRVAWPDHPYRFTHGLFHVPTGVWMTYGGYVGSHVKLFR